MTHPTFLIPLLLASSCLADDPWKSGQFQWSASAPLIAPADRPDDPCVSIKDPSLVRHDDQWHIYATIRCKSRVQMEYVGFPDWTKTAQAQRHVITLIDAYHCAPQVFYFTPHKKWYLVYQWADKNTKSFGPGFSTLDDPAKPATLTKPVYMYPSKPANLKGWLDFWIICDDKLAHLFFTSLDGKMWRAETKLADFPHGWNQPKVVLQGDIFEASHTYRLKGLNKYLTIIEAQAPATKRYYKAYLADSLDGKWTPLADKIDKPFAGEANVKFAESAWSDSISHGELVRDGVDETMTVDPANLQFLFQGCLQKERAGKGYGQYPWRLGVLNLSK